MVYNPKKQMEGLKQQPMSTQEGHYRIVEREMEKTKPEFAIGQTVQFKRHIARAGYYIEYTDCPIEEMNKLAIELIQQRIMLEPGDEGRIPLKAEGVYKREPTVDAETIKRILGALDWYGHRDRSARFSISFGGHRYSFDPEARYTPLKWVYRAARANWFYRQRGKSNLRTFWYEDLDEPVTGTIARRPLRQIGWYYPASGGSSGYYYDDYDPAHLRVLVYQQVYEVVDKYRVPRLTAWTKDPYRRRYLVHPLDVEEES
jgi:hypothetical protein